MLVLAVSLSPIAQAELEEVLVTATKRTVSIQDIAMSITQLGGDELDLRGITNIENLSYQVPNLQFGTFGQTTFVTIRGIGTTVDSGVAEPAVATYVDGVFLPRATMGILNHIDIERVEVLRGPQGTLYGRNATGGAINYISRPPAEEFEARLQLSAENRDGYRIRGMVSGPITDTVLYRFSAGKEEQDGYAKVVNTGQDLIDTDLIHARAALQFRPTDELTIDLAVQYEEDDAASSLQSALTPPSIAGNSTTEPNRTYGDGEFSAYVETTMISGIVNWDISDAVSLKSVTGYIDHENNAYFDADATDVFFTNLVNSERPSESWSQEFNLFGETERLSWLAGVFYYEEDYSLTIPVDFNLGSPDFPFLFEVVAGDLEEETTSYAAFVDLTYSLTDRLRILAGLRYNYEEKDFVSFGTESSTDNDDWLPKLGLQFDATDDVNVYAQFQQGIKSGGHQVANPEDSAIGPGLITLGLPTTFEPESLDSFEIGVKSILMDGRMTANAAVFYYDYSDLQSTTTIPPATTFVRNSDAEVMGGELEIVFSPNEALNFNLGLSLLDSEYKDFSFFDTFSQQEVNLDGEALVRAPEVTANFGVDWTISVNNRFLRDITLRGDIFYSDEYKLTFIDYPETRQDSYTTGSASILFTSPSERYMLRAFVDNIADEELLFNGSYLATTGAFIGYYSEPRTYGAELTVNF
jgi:iron complex outermembrane receptor protein